MEKVKFVYISVFVLLVIIIYPFLFSLNPITGGDYTSPTYNVSLLLSNFLGWCSYLNLGFNCTAINLHYSPIWWFISIFSTYFPTAFVERLIWWTPFLLASYLSSFLLSRKFFQNKSLNYVTPIIYTFNTYILMIIGGGQISGIGLGYAFYPVVVYSWIILLEKKKLINAIYCGLVLAIMVMLDPRVAFISALTIVVYLLIFLFNAQGLKIRKNFKRVVLIIFLPFIISLLLHFYWLLPALISRDNPLSYLGQEYISTNALKFFSFARLENSLGLLHPNWPENIFGKVNFMKSEFTIFALIAFSSLLFITKENSKKILFLVILALLGIFLAKGANDPFGSMYEFLFTSIPGFSLFRDSTKWYFLVALSYSLLIPFTLFEVCKKTKALKLILPLIFISFYIYILSPVFFGRLTIKESKIPLEYVKLHKILDEDRDFSRVLMLPSYQTYGLYNKNHPVVPGLKPLGIESNTNITNLLSINKELIQDAGIKYIIVPHDSEKEIFITNRIYDRKKYSHLVQGINKVGWIQQKMSIGDMKLWEVPSSRSKFSYQDGSSIPFTKINDTHYFLQLKGNQNRRKIIFSELYNSGWYAMYDKDIIQSVTFNKLFNSFNIPGNIDRLEIKYKPQVHINIGLFVSISSLSCIIGFIILKFVNEKINR